jgi:acyl carrier protein
MVIESIRLLASEGSLPGNLATAPLDGNTRVDDLGADSLGKLSLLSEIENRADVIISESKITNMRTLDDLAIALAECMNEI